ncbi:hypothetical protein [Coleofasciculus sp. H7-2]|uniref:hypothetical protein n=1 Tax=Coleofasciculus sp. H7-2 TaxID=3351545 RepID=UPI00366CF51B
MLEIPPVGGIITNVPSAFRSNRKSGFLELISINSSSVTVAQDCTIAFCPCRISKHINGVTFTESQTGDRLTKILAIARSPLPSLPSLPWRYAASSRFISLNAIALINNSSNRERHKIK